MDAWSSLKAGLDATKTELAHGESKHSPPAVKYRSPFTEIGGGHNGDI